MIIRFILKRAVAILLFTSINVIGYTQKVNNKECVNAQDFGALPDDDKDDSKAIQDALDYAYENYINKVFLPAGVYTLNHHISINIGCKLYANSTDSYLDFTNCSDSMAVVLLHYKSNIRKYKIVIGNNIALENIYLLGNNKSPFSDPVIYHKGLTALDFRSSMIGIKNCIINGFDRTTKFESHAYIITLEDCSLSFNNIGFSFDYGKYTDLGERILLTNCTIGNNTYGIYNNLGLINIDNSSIDFNKVQVKDNITYLGGQNRGSLRIYNSHLEGLNLDKNINVINNHGYMSINNCNILFSEPDGSNYISNEGELSINQSSVIGYSNNYLVKGNKPYISHLSYLSGIEVQKIHPSYSLINDNNLNTIFSFIGCKEQSNNNDSKKRESLVTSNNSILINKTERNAKVISKLIPITSPGNYYLTFDVKFLNKTNNNNIFSPIIIFYNKDSIEVNSLGISISKKSGSYVFQGKTGSLPIPKETSYCRIVFPITEDKVLIDNIYLIKLYGAD